MRSSANGSAPTPRLILFYVVAVGMALAAFLAVAWFGETTRTRSAAPAVAPRHMSEPIDTLLHVLLALAVIIVTSRAVGALFGTLRQPPIIGEVVGGILLGPSLLGRVSPELHAVLLPPRVAPFLGVIAQLGVILYMFIVGLRFDLRVVRQSGPMTLAISHASIIVPFVLGLALALGLYDGMAPEGATFTPFALFIGVAMSVTAFPVLARILDDRGLSGTRMGTIALTCAAVDDVTAWCLLAFVVSAARDTLGGAFVTLGLTILYIGIMLIVIRRIIARLIPRLEASERSVDARLSLIFVALLLSALATEFIGIHAIFGAFLLGVITPPRSRLATDVSDRIDDVVRVLFLPAFFAFTGMRTEVGLLLTASDWLICALIVVVATAGKLGGTLIASRLAGLGWRDSAALGILMNTRGLVELIVLNIGLDLGVITPRLFVMLVIMALVTTLMTSPILHLLLRRHPWAVEPESVVA
jgi:Kef-type K+ transport system membrane component KefB